MYERALGIYEEALGEEYSTTQLVRQNLTILDVQHRESRSGFFRRLFTGGEASSSPEPKRAANGLTVARLQDLFPHAYLRGPDTSLRSLTRRRQSSAALSIELSSGLM